MKIEVLGSGCAKCDELERVTAAACAQLGIDADIEHVSDMARILSFGMVMTPALVVDGDLRLSGRVPSVDEVAGLLERLR